MRRSPQLTAFFLILITVVGNSVSGQEQYVKLRVGMHIGSKVSDGHFTIEEISALLAKNHLDVGILNDHFQMEVEYGLFPWRKLIRKRVQLPSVCSFGIEKYLAEVKQSQESGSTCLLPGTEVSAFYYWQGNPLRRNLRLRNWHRHMLVFGLNSAADFEGIPTVSNNTPSRLSARSLLDLLYTGLFLWGVKIFKKRRFRKVFFRGMAYRVASNKNRFSGAALMVGVLLFLVNDFPFTTKLYSPYQGDQGALPYQHLIDYVIGHGGLVFWAHPEKGPHTQMDGVAVDTEPYPELLYQTQKYTGFAIFWEGMKRIGLPGGIWDDLLTEYCLGRRDKPVWAVGELDFEESAQDSLLRETSTILLARSSSVDDILDAFRKGRMYATRNFAADFLQLEDFSVFGKQEASKAVMGETLHSSQAPRVQIGVQASRSSNFTVQLIRDGKIIGEFNFNKSLKKMYFDEDLPQNGRHYYRVFILENDWVVLATNPIFVDFAH